MSINKRRLKITTKTMNSRLYKAFHCDYIFYRDDNRHVYGRNGFNRCWKNYRFNQFKSKKR